MRANGPGQSSLLLLDVVDILNESHISYAVIGALAASFYGTIRASMDADALVYRVDLLLGIRRMPEDIFSRTIHSPFLGSQIRIVGLEDFIAMN